MPHILSADCRLTLEPSFSDRVIWKVIQAELPLCKLAVCALDAFAPAAFRCSPRNPFGLYDMANWARLHVTIHDSAGAENEDRPEAPVIA
jgi:hypothetical protein